MRFFVLSTFVIHLFLATPTVANGAELTSDEELAVSAYLNMLRSCCLSDGAITMTPAGNDLNAPIWIAPYFGDHVALALLVSHERTNSPGDVELVRKWIQWRTARQEPGGYWFDHTGTVASYKSNGVVDAHDSSAALFLLVLERYQRTGGTISDPMRASAKSCLKCIQAVSDSDGLTWAKPDYKVKYLMDGIEVRAGLMAGEAFFTATKDEEASDCKAQAERINRLLPTYYEAKDPGLFAWVLHPDGTYDGGLEKLYPHGLAQLFGVSFVEPNSELFRRVQAKFKPETGPAATGAERFLMAATRLGGNTEKKWRALVLRDTSLTQPETYSYRPALAILALCEGTTWLSAPPRLRVQNAKR